jgi:NitT/TauT family transport system permease protein
LLSLLFTIVAGSLAAHSARAEKIVLPLLDIGQGIPVLGFLPGLVYGMVALFPKTNTGLELACIAMIFTGQVWNMAFGYYGSVRSIPSELREVARLQRFTAFQKFTRLELPAASNGLVWNSMMSMAGGWFFLTITEAFTLGGRDFRLPGLGSYMAVAIEKGDQRAIVWAIAVMVAMILAVDNLLWKPLAVAVYRFRLEEISSGEKPRSLIAEFVGHSRLVRRFRRSLREHRESLQVDEAPAPAVRRQGWLKLPALGTGLGAAALIVLSACLLWGALKLGSLLLRLPHHEWWELLLALGATGLRTAMVLLASVIWTVPVGILLGRSPIWRKRLQPAVQIAASFPAPMLYPLVTGVLLSLHVPFAVIAGVLMLTGAQWYVLFNVLAGASTLPHDLQEAANVCRLSGMNLWQHLYLPGIFPYLVTGLVTAAGGAWNASVVSETLVYDGREYVSFGLGSLITRATHEGNFPLLAAGVLTMSLALVLINRLVWRRLYDLAGSRFALNR